jgi:hypothetical protein
LVWLDASNQAVIPSLPEAQPEVEWRDLCRTCVPPATAQDGGRPVSREGAKDREEREAGDDSTRKTRCRPELVEGPLPGQQAGTVD